MTSLHLTNAFHDHSGGIRTTYLALLEHGERTRRRVVLVVPGERDGTEHVGRFATIHRVRAPRAPVIDRRYRLILPHRFVRPGRGPLWRILEQERPDLLEVSDKYSLCHFAGLVRAVRRRTGVGPTVIGSSCERLDDNIRAFVTPGPAGERVARTYLARAYIGQFDAHVANSTYTASELTQAMQLPHWRPVHVAPPGVQPPPAVTPAERAEVRWRLAGELGIPPDATCVVYAGRLSHEKNVSILPDLLARLLRYDPEIRMLILGDGPARATLARGAAALPGGRLVLHPHLADRRAFFTVLASADLFVHPNPREPFGIGPLEAMALGVPVVLPASGGVLTYASRQNAWLADPDVDALARAAHDALANPEARALRVAAALRTAAEHAWPAAASRLFALYDTIHRCRIASGVR